MPIPLSEVSLILEQFYRYVPLWFPALLEVEAEQKVIDMLIQ